MKTVAKDMYGELDLIDARPQISHMVRFSINCWLYYSICVPSGAFERKRQELLKAQREYMSWKNPENKMRKISQDMDALNKELDSLKNCCNDQQ